MTAVQTSIGPLAFDNGRQPDIREADRVFLGDVLIKGGRPWFDARAFGAIGDGVADDTAAFQKAITAAVAVDGTVVFPQPAAYYRLMDTITIQPVSGAQARVNLVGPPDPFAFKYEGANGKSVFKSLGWKHSLIRQIDIRVDTATDVVVWDADVDTTNNSSGNLVFELCRPYLGAGANNVGWRMGHTGGGGSELSLIDWKNCVVEGGAGANQLGYVSEHSNGLVFNFWNCGASSVAKAFTNTATAGAGSTAGGDTMNFYGCSASGNDIDFEFRSSGTYVIEGGRYETGKKFLVVQNGSSTIVVTVRGVKGSAYTPSDSCVFDWANITYNGGRPGDLTIENSMWAGSDYTAAFITHQGSSTRPSHLTIRGGAIRSLVDPIYTLVTSQGTNVVIENVQQINSSSQPVTMFASPVTTLTYSASITPNAPNGPLFQITATNGTAFTINAPGLPYKGQQITFDVLNSSGGAMGAITWNAVFKLAGAFTNPANAFRRTISFYYDGANWVETNRAAADI